jgi:hypothetical protein
MNIALVLGIVGGILVVAALLIILVLRRRSRRTVEEEEVDDVPGLPTLEGGSFTTEDECEGDYTNPLCDDEVMLESDGFGDQTDEML